jgi:D-sedoheptulose 7-phosphate isomerase
LSFVEYVSDLLKSAETVSPSSLDKFLQALINTTKERNLVWVAGNGGSAATASHFATDLSRCKDGLGHYSRAVSLNDNQSLITAIGNDFGFEFIFEKQLEANSRAGDLLVVISASGNSTNLVNAVTWAKANGLITVALLGFDGGKLFDIVDIPIHVKTDLGEYGLSEDCHSAICHFVSLTLKSQLVKL